MRSFDTETVVDSAVEAFWTHGYANTSPAQLVEATGLGKSSLYNAFGSKRELFDVALARYCQRVLEVAETFLAGAGTARECIAALFHQLIDSDLARQYPRGCLMVNTTAEFDAGDTEMLDALRRMQERLIARLAERIEQGRRSGDVRADIDPQATAEFLFTTLSGLRITTKIHNAATLHRVIDTALGVL